MEVRIYFERTDCCAKDPIQGGVVSDNPEQLDRSWIHRVSIQLLLVKLAKSIPLAQALENAASALEDIRIFRAAQPGL